MWHEGNGPPGVRPSKWVKVNEQGRIVARIHLKEGEYKSSKVVFDAEGLGTKAYLGSFFSLDQAKAAADADAIAGV